MGRIYGNDLLVRRAGPVSDLAPVVPTLASNGVTGVTDATRTSTPPGSIPSPPSRAVGWPSGSW